MGNGTKSCRNCGSVLMGDFCHVCGQKYIDEDRSLIKLIGSLLGNLFFFDNRLWTSTRSILTVPGEMTLEYLEGKRKKYIPPITLYLFVNLLFFVFNPISDYSLSLQDQMSSQTHSRIAKEMVKRKLVNDNLDLEDYSAKYNKASNNISKSIMIVNVPFIALFCFLLTFHKRRYFYDSLIFSLNFFSVFLLMIIVGDFLDTYIFSLVNLPSGIVILMFIVVIPLLYAVISFRNFLKYNWFVSALGGLLAMVGIAVSQLLYRGIIFLVTYLLT